MRLGSVISDKHHILIHLCDFVSIRDLQRMVKKGPCTMICEHTTYTSSNANACVSYQIQN